MSTDVLEPRLDLLRQEYVLVQAWKKTASYIRYHNWFSDTLELDRTGAYGVVPRQNSIRRAQAASSHW